MASLEETVPVKETMDEMVARHKKELKDMQYQNRQRTKKAKSVQGKDQKDAIAEANAMNLRDEDALQYRHRNELEEMDENGSDDDAAAQTPIEPAPVAQQSKEEDKANSKKNKAAKKREKERQKAKEREERIAAEKAGAGPSPRDIELAIISEKLKAVAIDDDSTLDKRNTSSQSPPQPKSPLRVHEILSDGHCLYRSIAHQVTLRDKQETSDYQSIRLLAATYMRNHESEFKPFIDLEKYEKEAISATSNKDDAYAAYCDIVEKSSEWGGHLELLAISHALKHPIRVYSAQTTEPLVVGWEEYGGLNPQPYEVCYHLHYYALGEHYNSTVPM